MCLRFLNGSKSRVCNIGHLFCSFHILLEHTYPAYIPSVSRVSDVDFNWSACCFWCCFLLFHSQVNTDERLFPSVTICNLSPYKVSGLKNVLMLDGLVGRLSHHSTLLVCLAGGNIYIRGRLTARKILYNRQRLARGAWTCAGQCNSLWFATELNFIGDFQLQSCTCGTKFSTLCNVKKQLNCSVSNSRYCVEMYPVQVRGIGFTGWCWPSQQVGQCFYQPQEEYDPTTMNTVVNAGWMSVGGGSPGTGGNNNPCVTYPLGNYAGQNGYPGYGPGWAVIDNSVPVYPQP
jgi:hypothetical protein